MFSAERFIYCENSACILHVEPLLRRVWQAMPRQADFAALTVEECNDIGVAAHVLRKRGAIQNATRLEEIEAKYEGGQ